MKRLFDIMTAILGLIMFSPLIILLSLLIRIDSKGNVFYTAKRIGKHEKPFVFYKFRTMKPNSDKSSITVGDKDQRITKVGFLLRKFKLDEIPQLFNVLLGNMSLVGPRPDVEKYTKYYKTHFKDYFLMKPGITCYSSIYFRNESELYVNVNDPEKKYIEETIPKKVELDKKYYFEQSLISDIKIIYKTLFKIVEG